MSRVSVLSARALPAGATSGSGVDLAADEEVGAAHDAAGLLQDKARDVALAHVVDRRGRRLCRDAQFLQGGAAERDGGFEGLAKLEVDLAIHELDGVKAIVGAHEGAGLPEIGVNELDDLERRLAAVDADADHLRLPRPGGPQHVEAGAVAVIDAEPEPAGIADPADVVVDHRDVDPVGEQNLVDHLPEAPEPDDEDAARQIPRPPAEGTSCAGDAS